MTTKEMTTKVGGAMDKIVMRSSAEAAKPHTQSGWLSRHGRFYLDERTARYDGCTHVDCRECGKPAAKSYTMCRDCIEKANLAKYLAAPRQKYDGGMVFSDAHDRYFQDMDEARDFAQDEGVPLEDLRLMICEPNYVRTLESDYCADELPPDDEGEVPATVEAAMQTFNEAVKGIILSWQPTKFAVEIES